MILLFSPVVLYIFLLYCEEAIPYRTVAYPNIQAKQADREKP